MLTHQVGLLFPKDPKNNGKSISICKTLIKGDVSLPEVATKKRRLVLQSLTGSKKVKVNSS